MKKFISLIAISVMILLNSCGKGENLSSSDAMYIQKKFINDVVDTLSKGLDSTSVKLMSRGVEQCAEQWKKENGTSEEFVKFCIENYRKDSVSRHELFVGLSSAFETLNGHFNEISLGLKKKLHLDDGSPLQQIDYIFGAYEASAHLTEDLYKNKIAFMTILNFPFYTLKEKDSLGADWSRLEWAYARMGDMFTPEPPAEIKQKVADAETAAESYISEYNIMMGQLVNKEGRKLFPSDMKLLSHWNLRDEIKSNYAPGPDNLEKQKMIYEVMLHIVNQTIPSQVINNPEYEWNVAVNTIKKDGKEVEVIAENAKRYEVLLGQFKAQKMMDKYTKAYPNAILRAFDGQMQISAEEIETMFKELISSPKVKEVAALINQRLGRDLMPYDIWYDGFKSRSSVSQEELDKITTSKYPTAEAFDKDIPAMLLKYGFPKAKADELGGAIRVEAARGSGHAWGAQGRQFEARLRTRLSAKGMDYKGFNIAVHELGHNVEQTITLRDVDYYVLNGVPNTAFTEALAFVFQKRDLSLLGYKNSNPDQEKMTSYDIFWGSYEIMGVALVDLNVWRWMYENPEATPEQLRDAVVKIAKDIWNQYYEPVLGGKDSPILAIYSHMINSPLYLANYPLGHIIEYQLEKFFTTRKWADEVMRIYPLGNITPQQWMIKATGEKLSVKSMLEN